MFPLDWTGVRKLRTRAHVIEEMSLNYLERKVLERGHQLVPAPRREYGWDATMFHFDPKTGEVENGEIRLQLKATDGLSEDKEFVGCRVATKDLHHWYWEAQRLPFVLVLYDAQRNRGYWLDVRRHIEEVLQELDGDQQTTTVRIPWENKVTVRTIDRFRSMSLARMAREG